MATMVSGSPLASRRAVRSKGCAKPANPVGAVQATWDCALGSPDAAGAGIAGLTSSVDAGGAGLTALPVAGAAVGKAGATIRAGAGISACAATKVVNTAATAPARTQRAIVIWLFENITASFAFSRHPDAPRL
jgi:hypothetical protein